ncbi:unnamed protein product [Owenia fusiformis]|uniref:Uncharacterized protein n=1 Tax=Owenia fusiformis TaxID=6347 RepID=A0A8S4Q2E0_OWEFU|nr:unnamed protein product [Owenia fusiformis]
MLCKYEGTRSKGLGGDVRTDRETERERDRQTTALYKNRNIQSFDISSMLKMASFVTLLLVGTLTVVAGLPQDLTCNPDSCAYKPPTKRPVTTGLGRYEVFNALLDCTYPTECGIRILKEFSRQLDDMKGCTMYYPLKEVGKDRLYVIFGCESVIAFEEAMAKKDLKFTCNLTPVIDYIDFATLTLGLELNETQRVAIMPRASLQCDTLLAVFRELVYPPGIAHEDILAAWKEHATNPIYYKASTSPEMSNYEVFHVVGDEAVSAMSEDSMRYCYDKGYQKQADKYSCC